MKFVFFIAIAAFVLSCGSPTAKRGNNADTILVKKVALNQLMSEFEMNYSDTIRRREIISTIRKEYPDFIPETLSYEEIMPSVLAIRLEQYNRLADQKYKLSK